LIAQSERRSLPNDSRIASGGSDPGQRKLRVVLLTLSLIVIGLIGFYLLRNFAPTLLLIFAGVLLGVFLDGLAVLTAKYLRLPRGLALLLVMMTATGCCALFVWLIGPRVVQEGQLLGEKLPHSIALLQTHLQAYDWGRALLRTLPSVNQIQLSFAAVLGSVSQAFSITLEVLGALVFIFFVGLYLAASPQVYLRGVLILVSPLHRARGREVMAALGKALRWWLLGRAVTMTLMGILTAIALWLAHVPLALVLGVIAGLLLFVPYLGALAAAIPAILVGLMESPAKALWVAVIYTGVHVFEGYCITPFVQQRAVALPPALLLSVQLLSAAFFGLMGVIFATPLTVVAIVLIQTLYVQDVLDENVAVLGEHEQPVASNQDPAGPNPLDALN
jgi:predicted PurR-regulated permease PerM